MQNPDTEKQQKEEKVRLHRLDVEEGYRPCIQKSEICEAKPYILVLHVKNIILSSIIGYAALCWEGKMRVKISNVLLQVPKHSLCILTVTAVGNQRLFCEAKVTRAKW